ncbi:hypothetical protein T484DRAFT_3646765, partial [Baffinella frigidus]
RTPNPKIRNPKPETQNPKPETQNPKPEPENPKPETRTRNPKPEPETRNLKPETRDPKPMRPWSRELPVRLSTFLGGSTTHRSRGISGNSAPSSRPRVSSRSLTLHPDLSIRNPTS